MEAREIVHAGLGNYCRLVVRHERYADNFLGFARLARIFLRSLL